MSKRLTLSAIVAGKNYACWIDDSTKEVELPPTDKKIVLSYGDSIEQPKGRRRGVKRGW